MNKQIIGCLLFALAGCANVETRSLRDRAKDNLERLVKAKPFIKIDLINQKGVSQTEAETLERASFEQLKESCLPTHMARLEDELQAVFSAVGDLNYATRMQMATIRADYLDSELLTCSEKFGVTAAIKIREADGEVIASSEYVTRLASNLVTYIVASRKANAEVAENRAIVADLMKTFAETARYLGYENPNQIYVAPYLRSNGGFVSGHYRTMPNETCLDNRRGCR